jgi:hypothetical protein
MRRKILGLGVAVALAVGSSARADPPSVPEGIAADSSLAGISLYEFFEPDGDPGQCNVRAHGDIVTPYDRWSAPIRIDTDQRAGGCRFNLAVVDPDGRLANWHVTMAFQATGDGGQCGNQGVQDVQIVRAARFVDNGRAVRIDTDDRSGGCLLSFTVRGNGPRLLVYFVNDDAGAGQCQRERDTQVVSPGETRSILIDTDRRDGGCLLQFRLR